MPVVLPELPYSREALSPHFSAETIDYHYGKHHKAYVDKLNNMVQGTEHEKSDLETIVKNSTGGLFNNAAQVLNHNFYWLCLSAKGGGQPDGNLLSAIEKNFTSLEKFKEEFSARAIGHFGSGWTWLTKKEDKLEIECTSNAETPLISSQSKAILTCDVWEHAYYIDYRNSRKDYLDAFWKVVNWDFVSNNLDS